MPTVPQPMTTMPGKMHHQRRIHYIDETTQKWLLLGLVLLEVILVLGLSLIMYRQLNQTIEQNLYRIHLAEAAPLIDQLLRTAMPLVGIFLVANVIALLVGYLIWRQYLNAILRQFLELVGKTANLDFTEDIQHASVRYELLFLTEALRSKERQRLTELRGQVDKLEARGSGAHSTGQLLSTIEALLPHDTRS